MRRVLECGMIDGFMFHTASALLLEIGFYIMIYKWLNFLMNKEVGGRRK